MATRHLRAHLPHATAMEPPERPPWRRRRCRQPNEHQQRCVTTVSLLIIRGCLGTSPSMRDDRCRKNCDNRHERRQRNATCRRACWAWTWHSRSHPLLADWVKSHRSSCTIADNSCAKLGQARPAPQSKRSEIEGSEDRRASEAGSTSVWLAREGSHVHLHSSQVHSCAKVAVARLLNDKTHWN